MNSKVYYVRESVILINLTDYNVFIGNVIYILCYRFIYESN